MIWSLIVCYLCIHVASFTLFFRHQPRFQTEGGVFLLHAVSATILIIIIFIWFCLAPSQERFALLIAAGAAHGIYSLSFLEVWALSDGGYSLRVLHEVYTRGRSTISELEAGFTSMSSAKKSGRLDSLLDLGLAKRDGMGYSLTRAGKIVAKCISTLQHLAQLEKTG